MLAIMPSDMCRYIFTRVTGSRTASPTKEAASRKRAFEEIGPSIASNKRVSPAPAAAPVDAAILKKLRTSNDVRLRLLYAMSLQQGLQNCHLCSDSPSVCTAPC